MIVNLFIFGGVVSSEMELLLLRVPLSSSMHLRLFENSLETRDKASMTLFQYSAVQLRLHHLYPQKQPPAAQMQLHHLYPQKGLLYPSKFSRESQSHCTSCSSPHIFHHWTIFVVASTARKHALISLPPLYFRPLEAQPYIRRR